MPISASTFGHLVELHLTSGTYHAIDPAEIVEMGPVRGQPDTTLVRLKNSDFLLYVRGEYAQVRAMIGAALDSRPC